jgi:hypothetical protein
MKMMPTGALEQLQWTVKWLVVEVMDHWNFVVEYAWLMKMRT